MSDIDLQNVSEKLANKLDDVSKKYEEAIAKRASQEEVETLSADLAAMKKQMQEIAVSAKQFANHPKSDHEVCRMIGETVMKAQSEGTDAKGGYLVEDEFSREIKSTQNRYGAVRQIWGANIMPMATDVMKVPVRVYGDTAGNQPEMQSIAENAQITADDGNVGQITLTANKYGTLVYVSNELIADSFIDFVGNYLRTQIAHEAAKQEDELVFNDAAGLLNSASIQETTMGAGKVDFSDATIEDYRALQDQVTDEAWEEGAYYAHRSVRTQMANIRVGGSTTTDGPFAWGNPNVGIPATLDGYNVTHVAKMPANSASAISTEFALFGDLPNAMLVGERGVANLSVSNDFRFDFDQAAVRYLFRFAFGTDANLGRAAARLKTAAA
jgi:HK97 family phage major capsid protein